MADTFIYFFKQTLLVLIYALDIALFLRAILSWFDPMQSNRFSGFLVLLTEPIIIPFRMLCAKFHWFEGFPIDMPFMMTILVLMVIQTFLTV